MEKEKLYENFKRLLAYPEWKMFEQHIEEIVRQHKEYSVGYLSKDRMLDAQRQAWICEGIMEALGEPRSIIDFEESLGKKIWQIVCHACGQRKDLGTHSQKQN